MASLASQQKHNLWLNSLVHGKAHQEPLHFINEETANEIYVFTREQSGRGTALLVSTNNMEIVEDADIDALIEGLRWDPDNQVIKDIHREHKVQYEGEADEGEPVSISLDEYGLSLQKHYFLKVLKSMATDFSTIQTPKMAAQTLQDFLLKMTKWGGGQLGAGDHVLLKPGPGPNEWEVFWEDGPVDWAVQASLGSGSQIDVFGGVSIKFMNVPDGPDWYTEANHSFSIVFTPKG